MKINIPKKRVEPVIDDSLSGLKLKKCKNPYNVKIKTRITKEKKEIIKALNKAFDKSDIRNPDSIKAIETEGGTLLYSKEGQSILLQKYNL